MHDPGHLPDAARCEAPADARRSAAELASRAAVQRALARAAGTWGGHQASRPLR